MCACAREIERGSVRERELKRKREEERMERCGRKRWMKLRFKIVQKKKIKCVRGEGERERERGREAQWTNAVDLLATTKGLFR